MRQLFGQGQCLGRDTAMSQWQAAFWASWGESVMDPEGESQWPTTDSTTRANDRMSCQKDSKGATWNFSIWSPDLVGLHISFFFFLINLFICLFVCFLNFWLCWVVIAVGRLSLVAVSRGYSSLQCVGFSLRWLLLLWSTGSRHAGFSSCGLRAPERRLSSCGARA